MQVTLFGAADTVTGSASLLENGGSRILVDCGMFMAEKAATNRERLPAKLTSPWPDCQEYVAVDEAKSSDRTWYRTS